MKLTSKKNKTIFLILFFIALNIFIFSVKTYAENININFSYGINKVAKDGKDLPIELNIENKDTKDFVGYVTLNVYENNSSVFIYRIDVDIAPQSTTTYLRNISITNLSNTIIINIYNRKEELVANERTNIDLSFYKEKLIIGILSHKRNELLYLDDLLLNNTSMQTKTVIIDEDRLYSNKNYTNTIDMLVISDYNESEIDNLSNFIFSLLNAGKPVFIGIDGFDLYNGLSNSNEYFFGDTLLLHSNYRKIININDKLAAEKIDFDNGIVVCVPYSFSELGKEKDAGKYFIDLIEKCMDKQWIMRINSSYESALKNDFYSVENLLNIVDKMKLPDIFIISILILFYLTFLIIILYVFLRNINKREQYGKFAVIFSTIYTFIMIMFGYSVMKKNTFMTYISIVNIKDTNTKETAFLNFRTSDNEGFSFDTGIDIKLSPILKNNKEPIVSYNFMELANIKSTVFIENENRKLVSVENAKNFDSNIFVYENNNYLNDVYNLDCSFQRMDGIVTGRITNKMKLTIRNACVLLYGKVIKIGDIEPNHSISLSRASNIGAPIGNNLMISDIISDESNRNILKYYLDENVFGYYDYGLLFGFIDDNGTIDINSDDIGDVYGRTLLVFKVNRDNSIGIDDYCFLENNVNNIEGYYDYDTNTISGESEVINEYVLSGKNGISKVYFEGIDNYDHGALESYVPFYGDIFVYNLYTGVYDAIIDNKVEFANIGKYLSADNRIIIKYVPLSRDPLYRKISLPVLRAIAEK